MGLLARKQTGYRGFPSCNLEESALAVRPHCPGFFQSESYFQPPEFVELTLPSVECHEMGPSQEPWLCRACEFYNRTSAQFCGRCGRPVDIFCQECGTENPGGHQFCDACGATLGGEASPDTSRPGQFGRQGLRLPNLGSIVPGKGLVWFNPAPNWQWSRQFFRSWTLRNRWEIIAVFLLTVAAAFLRVYRLEEIPAGFHGDEAWTGIEGLRILKEGWIGPYSQSALGQAAGPFYLTALMIWLLDASKFTVRLSMGLFGIATVPAAHLLLRLGFGRWVALFGTTALTVSYWHLHFSRVGFGVIPLAFASTAAAAALLWAMRTYDAESPAPSRINLLIWFFAGTLLGLVPYTYFAFPTFFAAVAAVLVVFFLLQEMPIGRKLLAISVLGLGMVLSAAPVLQFVFRSPSVFFGRLNDKSVWGYFEFTEADGLAAKFDFMVGRVWEALSLLVRNPRMDGVDGVGGVGAVDLGIAVLAYIGLAASIRRWRSPPHLFAVLVVLAALSGLILTDPSAGSMRRSITAIPWVFGLAGVGAATVLQLAYRTFGVRARTAAVGALAIVLIGSGIWNLNYYFVRLPRTSTFQWTFAEYYIEALDKAHSFEDPGTIYYFSGQRRFRFETIQFLYPDSSGIDRSREYGIFELEKLDPGPVTYLLEGQYMEEIDRIMEMYPGGELIVDDGSQPNYIVYHLSG